MDTRWICKAIPAPLRAQALDKAAIEFEQEYLPELERRVAEAKSREEAAREVRVPQSGERQQGHGMEDGSPNVEVSKERLDLTSAL